MEKNLNSKVVKLTKEKILPRNLKNDSGNDLLLEDDLEKQSVRTDLSELDDLTQIYGEMTDIL